MKQKSQKKSSLKNHVNVNKDVEKIEPKQNVKETFAKMFITFLGMIICINIARIKFTAHVVYADFVQHMNLMQSQSKIENAFLQWTRI